MYTENLTINFNLEIVLSSIDIDKILSLFCANALLVQLKVVS